MKFLKLLKNYLCYCGIEKEDYKPLKRDMYISNFKIWRFLHCLMTAVFGFLFINSLFSELLVINRLFYMISFIYSIFITTLFFIIRKDSFIAQLLIYLSISVLLLIGALITQNQPNYPSTTFMVMLIITPMFMIDKPFFMGIVIAIASIVFGVWMYYVKPYEIWQADLVNVIIFEVVGFLIHIVSNSIRIKEFVLTRTIRIQKDTDELTGLKNKAALTKDINDFLLDKSRNQGIMFLLDIDHFKSINDTYGHDVGDNVIRQFGEFLGDYFRNDEIVGRFGGDEFIFFIKDTNSADIANKIANDIVSGAAERVTLPDKEKKISASIGIALYRGIEENYSEIFKKADMALYEIKSHRKCNYQIYE